MEESTESKKSDISFLGKKTKKYCRTNVDYKSEEFDRSLFSMETSAELTSEVLLFDKKSESKDKIFGFDDIKIPTFLNDIEKDNVTDNIIKNYKKVKEELGSSELAKLYLIDINKIINNCKKKKNYC